MPWVGITKSCTLTRSGSRLGRQVPAAILEIADKFLLFGIYRNDRMAFFLSTLYLLVEIVELGVPIRVLRPFFGLSIRLQGVAEPVQQPVDDAATQRVAQSLQLSPSTCGYSSTSNAGGCRRAPRRWSARARR